MYSDEPTIRKSTGAFGQMVKPAVGSQFVQATLFTAG